MTDGTTRPERRAEQVAAFKAGHEPDRFNAIVEPLRAVMVGLFETAEEMREHFDFSPCAGSIAANQQDAQLLLAGEWGDRPIDDAFTILWLLIAAAEGHGRSVADLLILDRVNPTSIDVLARAALETLARALWLAEPILDIHERVRRVETDRLYSAAENAKLAGPAHDDAVALRERILRTGETLGWKKLPAQKGTPPRYVNRPTATSLVGQLMLDRERDDLGQFAYRLLSASAHGTIYGLVRYVKPVDEPVDGMGIGAITVSAEETVQLISIVMLAYLNAMDRATVLYGWEYESWRKSVANARMQLWAHRPNGTRSDIMTEWPE